LAVLATVNYPEKWQVGQMSPDFLFSKKSNEGFVCFLKKVFPTMVVYL